MLGWRLGISAVLIPSLIGLFIWDAKLGDTAPVLLVLCVLLTVRATWETVQLLRQKTPELSFAWPAAINVCMVAATWLPHLNLIDLPGGDATRWMSIAFPTIVFSIGVMVLFLLEAIRFQAPGRAMQSLSAGLLSVIYAGFMLVMTAQLRWVEGFHPYTALAALVIGVKMGDVGGYTFGRLFGKKKLIPRLSPGKTQAGGIGAVVTASVATWGWLAASAHWSESEVCTIWALCFGAALGIVGLIGDLCESLIKRDMEQKDSAVLMPGFGGLLDLLDSILYTGPAAWLAWVVSDAMGWI